MPYPAERRSWNRERQRQRERENEESINREEEVETKEGKDKRKCIDGKAVADIKMQTVEMTFQSPKEKGNKEGEKRKSEKRKRRTR